MSGFRSLLLLYLLNSLWQVPLLMAAAWVAARLVRPAGPAAEHRVWVGALLLESVVPAASLLPWERMQIAWPWHAQVAAIGDGQVSVEMGAGAGFAAWQLPPRIAAVLVILYVAVVVYLAIRFVWHLVRLRGMIRSARPVVCGDAATSCSEWMTRFEMEGIVVGASESIFAPVTMGAKRKRVLLPRGFAEQAAGTELDAALAHEFAHIRRNDYAKNLAYEVVSLAVNYHPAFWFTRQRVTETREMVCDEMAAEGAGSQEYAQSLLRLAALVLQGGPVRVPHAVGIFDANTLERRLMKLTEKKEVMGRVRWCLSMGACVVIGVATATSAVGLGIGVGQESSADSKALSKSVPATVSAEKMAGNLISKVSPVYPPDAKKARIQGKVLLKAVIGKDGHVEHLDVVSGPSELQQSSVDAVRQWVYKPYLLNGDPIEVETTISVIYTLKK